MSSELITWPTIRAGATARIKVPNVIDQQTGLAPDLDAADAVEFQVRKDLRKPGEPDVGGVNPLLFSGEVDWVVNDDDTLDVFIDIDAADTGERGGRHAADLFAIYGDTRRLIAVGYMLIDLTVNRP